MNRIIVTSLSPVFDVYKSTISRLAKKIILASELDGVRIDFYLANDAFMRRLNRDLRGKDKATDILSFCEPEIFQNLEKKKNKGLLMLGEIYLNPQKIEDFTSKKNGNFNRLDLLMVHGLMHLLGYTHKTKNDRMIMEKKERAILSRLDIAL